MTIQCPLRNPCQASYDADFRSSRHVLSFFMITAHIINHFSVALLDRMFVSSHLSGPTNLICYFS